MDNGKQEMGCREVHGIHFYPVLVAPFHLPPHWVHDRGKPVMVIPPHESDPYWQVYAPLSGHGQHGLLSFIGDEAEERAFSMAAVFAKQT